jgi:CheY-specific phosphatase CheX
MNVRYINPFIASVKNVFQMMVATDVNVGRPFIISPQAEPNADVSAVIGFRRRGRLRGVTISMDTATRRRSDSPHRVTERPPDFGDAIGELPTW